MQQRFFATPYVSRTDNSSTIYINRDLTPSETKAAYDERVLKREKNKKMEEEKKQKDDNDEWQPEPSFSSNMW